VGIPTSPLANGNAVSIDAPKAADAFLKRGIDIKLSSSGVDYWEYQWCPAPGSAGSCGSVHTVIDKDGDNAAVDNGVVDYSDTKPDANWLLAVRPHGASTWNGGGSNQPLKVHTPKIGKYKKTLLH
jgi:hypothetical protein